MNTITPNIDLHSVVSLGLSKHEAMIYGELLRHPRIRPRQLAEDLNLLTPSVHRTLSKLVDKGFALRLDASPALYQAISPRIAVNKLVNFELSALITERDKAIHALSLMESKTSTAVQLITGSKQWYELYCERTKQAKREVLVVSIGEQVDPKVRQAFSEAVERGVKHRFIFHRYTKDNEAILKGWLKTGDTQVRHFPDSGYHLVIWDSKELALVASNPDDPSERSGMFIKSPRLANSMRNYFFSIWEQALPITRTSFLPS